MLLQRANAEGKVRPVLADQNNGFLLNRRTNCREKQTGLQYGEMLYKAFKQRLK